MNCTKCGKEIPDGENTICEDCKKELLKEIETENNDPIKEEKAKKRTRTKKTDKKVETKTNSYKVIGANKKNINVVSVAACAVVIVIIAVLCLILFSGKGNSGKNSGGSNVGNSIGNIRNYGYGTSDGSWIYFLSPNKDATKIGISRIKNNGKNQEEIYMGDLDVLSINVHKNYVYFIGIGRDAYSAKDDVDNKIYRMKKNGSDLEVINDNGLNNDCYEIYVVNDSIYYIGTDQNIYKMDLDGKNSTLVSENGTGYIGVTDKYILYNVENKSGDDYVTYIMSIDGKNPRPVIEDTRLYSVDIRGNYVYYTNFDKKVFRTKIDSGVEEPILDSEAYNLNLQGNYLYFLNYLDFENEDYTICVFRVKADGTGDVEEVKRLSKQSTYINVVGDWVMYMDYDNDSAFINLVNKDGNGKEVQVYKLNYSDIPENDNYEDQKAAEENNGTQEETQPEETNTVTNTTTTNTAAPANTAATNTAAPANTTPTNTAAPATNTVQ